MNYVYKPVYRVYRMLSWMQHWVERRFTKAGLSIVIGLVASSLMSVDTDNSIAYQAFAVLLLLLLVAISCSAVFPGRFSTIRHLPRFGTVGQPLKYSVLVKNLTPKPQNGLTLLEDFEDARLSFDDWLAIQLAEQRRFRSFRLNQQPPARHFRYVSLKEATVPSLPLQQEASVDVELTPLKRGLLRFAGVTVARPDPLGLFKAYAKMPLPQSVLILPRRYLLPAVELPGLMKYQQGGVAQASNVGQNEEFLALRDYRHGDPLRHIHWRSWARAGKPVVKEFEDEFFVRHALVLDTFIDHPQSEVFEEAVSVAASFACTIQTQESLLDLLFVGPDSFCFTSGRGLAQADQMLEILASVRPCPERPFSELEHLVLNHVGVVSGCICVLLAWDQPRRDFVEKLRRLGVPVLALVVAAPGQAKGLDAGPMRDDPRRFCVLEAGRIEEGLAKLPV
jgi:uncharacterized protein (DUF58 family)